MVKNRRFRAVDMAVRFDAFAGLKFVQADQQVFRQFSPDSAVSGGLAGDSQKTRSPACRGGLRHQLYAITVMMFNIFDR